MSLTPKQQKQIDTLRNTVTSQLQYKEILYRNKCLRNYERRFVSEDLESRASDKASFYEIQFMDGFRDWDNSFYTDNPEPATRLAKYRLDPSFIEKMKLLQADLSHQGYPEDYHYVPFLLACEAVIPEL